MKRWAPMVGALVCVAAFVAADDGRGFPRGGGGVPPALTAATSVTSPLGKFDVLDAGVLNVAGQFCANSQQLCATASGVQVNNDFFVNTTNNATFNSFVRINGSLRMAGSVTDSATAPTISAGGCTSPSVAATNGTALFRVTIGSSCAGISTVTLTMPTASTGWNCFVVNRSASTNNVRQSNDSTTTVVLTNYGATVATPADFTAGHVLQVACRGG